MRKFVPGAIAALLISACNQPPALPNPAGSAASPVMTMADDAAPAVTAVSVDTDAETEDNRLRVVPAHVYRCAGRDRVVAAVTWSVADQTVENVEIRVTGPGENVAKVFTAGGTQGLASTGPWVTEGVGFSLVDAATGRELDRRVIRGLPCE